MPHYKKYGGPQALLLQVPTVTNLNDSASIRGNAFLSAFLAGRLEGKEKRKQKKDLHQRHPWIFGLAATMADRRPLTWTDGLRCDPDSRSEHRLKFSEEKSTAYFSHLMRNQRYAVPHNARPREKWAGAFSS
jgi:hypothetical protein